MPHIICPEVYLSYIWGIYVEALNLYLEIPVKPRPVPGSKSL
jgi:hypothetical protein